MNDSDRGFTVRLSGHPRWLDYGLGIVFATLAPIALFVYEPMSAKLLVFVSDVGLAAYFLRAARAGVSIDRDGLTIRDIWRTRRLPWLDVNAFGVRNSAWVRSMAYVELKTGKHLDIRSIVGTRWRMEDNPSVVSVVRRLEDALQNARRHAQPSPQES
jgi:hypothetical protein